MIRLPDTSLPASVASRLLSYQCEIDALPSYAKQVEAARRDWPRKNRSAVATFRTIRETLAGMCSGRRRCGYCEDSCADEIEHIQPKDLYPEFVFAWGNYLHACGRCNVEKRNDYAVFTSGAGADWADVKRSQGAPVIPPRAGDPVLINPRTEDPLDFLLLDLRNTFRFVPLPGIGHRMHARAQYTVDTLGLNARDHLVAARQDAFVSYRAILKEYIHLKRNGADVSELNLRIGAIQGASHATVWHEMKRWTHRFPGSLAEIDAMFAAVPEARTW